MGFDYCSKCQHKFTKIGNDVPHTDGGAFAMVHGGGVCRNCYISDGEHKECTSCKGLMFVSSKFCSHCGVKNESIDLRQS